MKIRFIFLLIFILNSMAWAKPLSWMESQFEDANENYLNKDYDQAIYLYDLIEKSGLKSSSLQYNIGNAYFETNQLGLALIHYYRAYELSPRDSDTQNNLNLAKEKVLSEIEYDRPNIFEWMGLLPKRYLNQHEMKLIILILFWFSFLLFWKLTRIEPFRTLFFISVLLFLWIGILWTLNYRQDRLHPKAVVVREEVSILASPRDDGQEKFKLYEGVLVRISQERYGWYRIDLSNKLYGWIKKDQIMKV